MVVPSKAPSVTVAFNAVKFSVSSTVDTFVSTSACTVALNSARVRASELQNPRLSPLVVQYIGRLREERLKKYEVTYEGHVAELARIKNAALKKGSKILQNGIKIMDIFDLLY